MQILFLGREKIFFYAKGLIFGLVTLIVIYTFFLNGVGTRWAKKKILFGVGF